MEYHIEVRTKGEWNRIASFENEIDRNDCGYFLQEKYPDCKFRKENENE